MTLPKWQNFFKKITTLNLTERLRNKFRLLILVLNLRLYTHVYGLSESIGLFSAFIILMMYFYLDSWQKKLRSYLDDLNKFHPKNKFAHEKKKEGIHFSDFKVRFSDVKVLTGFYLKSAGRNQFLSNIHCLIQITPNVLQSLVRHLGR